MSRPKIGDIVLILIAGDPFAFGRAVGSPVWDGGYRLNRVPVELLWCGSKPNDPSMGTQVYIAEDCIANFHPDEEWITGSLPDEFKEAYVKLMATPWDTSDDQTVEISE